MHPILLIMWIAFQSFILRDNNNNKKKKQKKKKKKKNGLVPVYPCKCGSSSKHSKTTN